MATLPHLHHPSPLSDRGLNSIGGVFGAQVNPSPQVRGVLLQPARPAHFADTAENSVARQLFQDVVISAYRVIIKQPEFAAELLQRATAV